MSGQNEGEKRERDRERKRLREQVRECQPERKANHQQGFNSVQQEAGETKGQTGRVILECSVAKLLLFLSRRLA